MRGGTHPEPAETAFDFEELRLQDLPNGASGRELDACEAFRRTVCNDAACETSVSLLGRSWLMPARSRFVMADMERWSEALLRGRPKHGYDLIMADPPWANKSAQRGSKYQTTAWSALPSLPVARLASPAGCLVAVWLTNKKSYWTWVKDTVFPAWGVRALTTWYWLKVTTRVEPVLPLCATRERKPYEPVLIGSFVMPPSGRPGSRCVPPPDEAIWGIPPTTSDPSMQGESCEEYASVTTGAGLAHVPLRRVLLSSPSGHSAKPALEDVLYGCFNLGNDARHTRTGLELFARSLRPNFTGIGNEPLQQQEASRFRSGDPGPSEPSLVG